MSAKLKKRSPRFSVMLSPELREPIRELAEKNSRLMRAEIELAIKKHLKTSGILNGQKSGK